MPRKPSAAPPALAAPPEQPVEERADLHSEDTGEDVETKQAVKPALGRLRDSDLAREAAQKRWGKSRQTHTLASAGLRAAAQSQYDIATGPKSVPASARTAAARAYADLIVAAEQAEEREGGRTKAIDWDAMTLPRMTLLRMVLDSEEGEVQAMLTMMEEERNARAAHVEESDEEATPTPPE